MKNIFVPLCLFALFVSTTGYATGDQARGNGNPIMLYNKTNTDVAYIMETFSFSAVYGIKKGQADIYHSKHADEYVTIKVGECKKINHNGLCEQVDFVTLQNCVGNVHYNGDLISAISIKSLNSCTVTCLDGGTTSCKQTG